MTKAAEWAERVEQWRASGLRSAEFCRGREFTARNLLWWSSHFRRQGPPTKERQQRSVTFARVVRSPKGCAAERHEAAPAAPAVTIELSAGRVRVDSGADRSYISAADAERAGVDYRQLTETLRVRGVSGLAVACLS